MSNTNSNVSRLQDSLKVAQDKLKIAQDKLGDHYDTVRTKGKEAFDATHGYVTDNPWNAVGIGVGIGFVIGICFSAGVYFRRGGDDDDDD